MMFLGTFIGFKTSLDPTPVATGTTEYFEIENGIFDEVYLDSDTEGTQHNHSRLGIFHDT